MVGVRGPAKSAKHCESEFSKNLSFQAERRDTGHDKQGPQREQGDPPQSARGEGDLPGVPTGPSGLRVEERVNYQLPGKNQTKRELELLACRNHRLLQT